MTLRRSPFFVLGCDLLLLIAGVHLLRALLPTPWRLALFPLLAIGLAIRGARAFGIPLAPYVATVCALRRGLRDFAWTSAIWLPLYLGAAHLALTHIVGWHYRATAWPSLTLIATQIFLIALPEEYFFRGYLQPALEQRYADRWRIGAWRFGPALFLTAALFAAAHSAIGVQWWHFAIFIPGLLFGALRKYSDNLIAGTLAHALSNLAMWWLSVNYR